MATKKKEKKPVFAPCSEKQRFVLQECESDLFLTGGGAGSGKSFLSLLKAVKFVQESSEARIMVLRLSYPMLKDLIAASQKIYPHFGGIYKTQARTWVFPNGAEIDFKAMPKDLYEVQGWERTHYFIDEAAEWEQDQVLAVLSRLRSATYKGKKSLMMSCNPSKSSWLRPVVDYSLDSEGVPKPGTETITRYFIVQNSHFKWANSEEELYELYGQGLEKGTEFIPLKFKFCPMTCYDNPAMLKVDPGYPGRLLAQPRVNVLRLLRGSWDAEILGAAAVTEDMFEIVPFPPTNPINKIRAWDLAMSVPNELNNYKCDFSVGILMSKDAYGNFYIEHMERFQRQVDGVLKGVRDTAYKDGLDIPQLLPVDPGSAGKVAAKFFVTWLAENGITVKTEGVSPHSNKMTRFGPFASVASNRLVKVVQGDWNRDFFDELCWFTGERKNHDDIVDATSSAFNQLARSVVIPPFSLPNLTQASPIPTIN